MTSLQTWIDTKTVECHEYIGNVYFHFNICCVQNYYREMNAEEIARKEDTFAVHTPGHLHFLRHKGFLKTIVTY